MITNPVLKGFNPDPSAINVLDTIYVAVSTFQWLPGVIIYKTTDLKKYEYVCAPVKIDMSAHPADTTIWAPNLSYYNGTFYLLYTVVTSTNRPFKDMKNYVIYTKDINEEWSDPVYLNSNGFDPAFYHDDSGIYLLQTLWDYRITTPNKSAGIVMQKLERNTFRQLSDWVHIFKGTDARKTEAPNLYLINDYYYLLTAEGGTGRDHQVTVARSKNIWGPYDVSPITPMMSTKGDVNYLLQCTGHASLVEFKSEYYLYYLTKRLDNGVESIMGRETGITPICFDNDGWPKLKNDSLIPPVIFGDEINTKPTDNSYITSFKELDHNFQMPFLYDNNKFEITNEGLKLKAMASIQSTIDLSLVGYRVKDIDFSAEVLIKYIPYNFQQMAGISLYLNHENFIFFYLTKEDSDVVVKIIKKKDNKHHIYKEKIVTTEEINNLKIIKKDHKLKFIINNKTLNTVVNPMYLNKTFSGTMIGLSAHDFINYNNSFAVFKKFIYRGE